MYEADQEAAEVNFEVVAEYDRKEVERGQVDPFCNPLAGPYAFADGVLMPKPMLQHTDWENMGLVEQRALFYTLCKFHQLNRTGAEWKAWGCRTDEVIWRYSDTSPYYFVTLFIFLDVFMRICAPTARKAQALIFDDYQEWQRMIAEMQEAVGGTHERLTAKGWMEMVKPWFARIGVPRDIHAAMADFVPGMCNIFRIRDCQIAAEYNRRLNDMGGEPCGMGRPPIKDVVDRRREEQAEEVPRGTHAILFAGDGSERLGMLRAVADLPRVREKLEVAREILGYDVLELCVDGPTEKLSSLEYCGVAMYMAGWAAYERLLQEDPARARSARAVAGLDVGEYVALSVAGILPFETGLELARVRGTMMKALAEGFTDQAACSVAGLDEDKVTELCKEARARHLGERDLCQITTSLFSRGFLVAGRKPPVESFVELAIEAGALQAKVLPGQTANHSPLMQPAQWALKAKFREHHPKLKNPWCDVYFNGNADVVLEATERPGDEATMHVQLTALKYVAASTYTPVRWNRVIEAMIKKSEVDSFIECGPHKQLKALIKRINKEFFERTENVLV